MQFSNLTRFALLLGILAPALSSLQAEELTVGVVDYARVQRHYYRTDLERKALETKREEERKKVEEEVASTKELIDAQQEAQDELQDPTLSDEKKQSILTEAQKRAAEINAIQRKALELQQAANSTLAQEASRAHVNLNKEIYEAIDRVAQAKGLDLVHNRTFGVNGVPSVAYANSGKLTDITDDVIGDLNKNAPAGWSAPEKE